VICCGFRMGEKREEKGGKSDDRGQRSDVRGQRTEDRDSSKGEVFPDLRNPVEPVEGLTTRCLLLTVYRLPFTAFTVSTISTSSTI
jgi:hypothetical protein